MPFKKIYAVKFWDGNPNLHPHVNERGWSDMKLGQSNAQGEWYPDASGMTFRATRGPSVSPNPPPARNQVFVKMPYGGIPLKTLIRLQLTFDTPLGEGFAPDETLHPTSYPFNPDLSQPESWAIGLNVSPYGDLSSDFANVNVTCQFNRSETVGGFMLNTPGSLQGNAGTTLLRRPLDYSRYNPIHSWPVFILEHFFSGHVGAVKCGHTPPETKTHTTGSGYLGYYDPLEPTHPLEPTLEDRRSYSSQVFLGTAPTGPISCLGATLVTLQGVGRVSARFRTFTVWISEPLAEGAQAVTDTEDKL